LFIALLLGIVLAATFFAGINVGADTAAKQALDQALSQVPVDIYTSSYFTLSSNNITNIVGNISAANINGVKSGGVEAISRASLFQYRPLDGKEMVQTSGYKIVGVRDRSSVYDGWVGGAPTWEANKTYVWADSPDAGLWQEGSVISLNITVPSLYINGSYTDLKLPINLTVAGFVRLEDKALAIAQGSYYYISPSPFGMGGVPRIPEDLLIVSWEKTLAPFLDRLYELSPSYGPITTDFLVFIDRSSVISVWDIPGSVQRLNVLKQKIDNAIRTSGYSLNVYGILDSILTMYSFTFSMMRVSFVVVSLPVFFVAWYMGSTVSDVSFNLRRREIGLMLTKGFSRSQLFRMFLSEAFLIGLAGGIIGIVLSLALNPLFIMAIGGVFSGLPVIGIDTAILTVAFSVIITFLVVFRPARRASNMATVDALKEYMYVEEVKPYKRLWPWVAFILGHLQDGHISSWHKPVRRGHKTRYGRRKLPINSFFGNLGGF